MPQKLHVTSALWSEAGIKPVNEDACGIRIPEGALRNTKGIAAVVADGISGSEAGKEASSACVQGFLTDYFSTPETWSVKNSGGKVLAALNRWLYGQGHRLYQSDRALVTTFSALVIKSNSAYLFHVGDTRIYRLRANEFICLTHDHRIRLSGDKNYLGRAMGVDLHIDIDFRIDPTEVGDTYLLTTDGIHDYLEQSAIEEILNRYRDDPKVGVRTLGKAALENGSRDNVTCQILRIDRLPNQDEHEFYRHLTELPFPPPLEVGMVLDGYKILREIHASKRTQIYVALDVDSNQRVILKTPSVNFDDDPAYIEQFLQEEWAGKRIDSPNVLKVIDPHRRRQCLYYVTEYLEGQTLRSWMQDHPKPTLVEVRAIIEQISVGLRSFHRMEMIHQDLKPENILIDKNGLVKIIDFGSAKIAGIEEIATPVSNKGPLGTVNYTAPEYLQGCRGSNRSDIYSLAVIAYELLTGKLPFGDSPNLRKLQAGYHSASERNPEIPAWMDAALEKALAFSPEKRYEVLSEFLHDLSHPSAVLVRSDFVPLIDRNPVAFWRSLALLFLLINIVLSYLLTH
ncbi:MAG: bifunctional protein-serine/threonine kinase/phosphatase [Gammaproteobacteria bacterium]|nr:bifunctional protein-serine/threonine kinase/phosphatase [Gammaproteobacteria bacterium]